ncbi:MAG: hypothetical protein CHACPFDD_00065 [Phycisphaerae bacterium]|nr:hypothetical protein [Phycisphaerae bacterium]
MYGKQMMKRMAAIVTGLTAMTAANADGRWGDNHVTIHVDKGNWPVGSKQTYMKEIVRIFNLNPSNFWVNALYDLNNGTGSLVNGRSEIFMSSKESAPATTYNVYTWFGLGDEIVESDIRVSTKETWTYSYNKKDQWAFNGGGRPLETTLLHELGHAAGLDHETDVYNIMGEDYTHVHCNGTSSRGYLGEDACNALVSKYGRYSGGSIEDVSVSAFKRVGQRGSNGQWYSDHDFCVLTDAAGNMLWRTWDATEGLWRFSVSKGQTIITEYTFENNGETTQTPQIGIYISTDNNITTADRFMGSFNWTLSRSDDGVETLRIQFALPTNLNSATNYFIGAIVDYDGKIAEVDAQNAAYHMIRVR